MTERVYEIVLGASAIVVGVITFLLGRRDAQRQFAVERHDVVEEKQAHIAAMEVRVTGLDAELARLDGEVRATKEQVEREFAALRTDFGRRFDAVDRQLQERATHVELNALAMQLNDKLDMVNRNVETLPARIMDILQLAQNRIHRAPREED